MSDSPADSEWVDVSSGLEPDATDRAVALLQAEEIEHRLSNGVIEVPASLEADAVAVLSGLDDEPDPGPDQAADFAKCTARISDVPMSGIDAQVTALALTTAGVTATTDAPGGIGGSEVHLMAQCYVLVRPEDLERARAAVEGLSEGGRDKALRRVASEMVAAAVPPEIAPGVEEMLASEGIECVLRPNPEEDGRLDVFVRPTDGPKAQQMVSALAQAAAAGTVDPAAEPEPPADGPAEDAPVEGNTQASILLFAALAVIAFLVMRSCK